MTGDMLDNMCSQMLDNMCSREKAISRKSRSIRPRPSIAARTALRQTYEPDQWALPDLHGRRSRARLLRFGK